MFFGVESQPRDPSQFVIPIEAVSGVLFVLVALALVGPGQQLGRSLARVPNRIEAYTVNIGGSLAGILLFTACSWWELGPVWWFGGVLRGDRVFLEAHSPSVDRRARGDVGGHRAAGVRSTRRRSTGPPAPRASSGRRTIGFTTRPESRFITVNLIGHQQMSSREDRFPAYALPHCSIATPGARPSPRSS